MMEYSLAWNNLRPGGVLLSDDIHSCDAFIEFTEIQKSQPLVVKEFNKSGFIGLLVKPSVSISDL